jgi:hypothetical protein
LVAVAGGLFAQGGSIGWIAIAPQKWSHLADAVQQLRAHAVQYLALLVLWSALFGLGAVALDFKLSRFLPSFALVFVAALLLYFLGQWNQASHYNLEPPLVALALGLLISDIVGVPRWAHAGLRVEFYIKTGIVLLGAGLPLTLMVWARYLAAGSVCAQFLATTTIKGDRE